MAEEFQHRRCTGPPGHAASTWWACGTFMNADRLSAAMLRRRPVRARQAPKGTHNPTLKEILGMLADIVGKHEARILIPHRLALLMAHVNEAGSKGVTRPPGGRSFSPQSDLAAPSYMFYPSDLAVREPGVLLSPAHPPRRALSAASPGGSKRTATWLEGRGSAETPEPLSSAPIPGSADRVRLRGGSSGRAKDAGRASRLSR